MSVVMNEELESRLRDLCHLLINQQTARVIVAPYANEPGYWFGGGNLISGPNGDLYLVGRYRNEGDSRTGLAAGSRGLELAIFWSEDNGETFEKALTFRKEDLSVDDGEVLSIEGTALRWSEAGVDLYVSTEKAGRGYPDEYSNYLKPGTGVWSIDRIQSDSLSGLKSAPVIPLLSSDEPSTIHVKDPFLFESAGGLILFYCTHPLSWTCSNTGYVSLNESGSISNGAKPVHGFFPRGDVWDVAMTRGTAMVQVPRVGRFTESDTQLIFYDGGECVRDLQPHSNSVSRPRGYSCEELGGAAYVNGRSWNHPIRLSRYEPLFVSPTGTGCNRYVDILARPEGMYATWQRSQHDGSQPLMMNFVPQAQIESVLG